MADSEVQVVLVGSQALIKKIEYLGNFLQSPTFRSILEDAGQMYVDLAKKDAPISRSPGASGLVAGGALRSSIQYSVENFGTTGVTVRVGAGGPGARYAMYVEQGTQPSMRVPINKEVMYWVEDGAGRTVQMPWTGGGLQKLAKGAWEEKYRKFVWHPGTRAQPFFFTQMPIVVDRLTMAIQRAINQRMSEGGDGGIIGDIIGPLLEE